MTKPLHSIADVRFSTGHLRCACGWLATPDVPAGMALQYQGHRRDSGVQVLDVSRMRSGNADGAPFTIKRRRTRRHR